MRGDSLLPQPVKRQKLINVPKETALNLENELELAKAKFQFGGGRRDHSSKTHRQAKQKPRPELDESFKALSQKVKDYEAVKSGKLKNDVLAPSADQDDSSSSGSDSENDSAVNDFVEVEFADGVVRKVPRGKLGPNAPDRLIYGDVIQRGAFQLDYDKVHQLQEEKDEDTHYDADWEKRDRGVGFFKFSKSNEERREQMETLKAMREETIQKNAEVERKRLEGKQRETKRWEQIALMRQKALERLHAAGQYLELAPLTYRTREEAWDELFNSIYKEKEEEEEEET